MLTRSPRVTLVEGLRWRGDGRSDLFAVEERMRDGLTKGKPYVKLLRELNLNPEQLENVAWSTAAGLFRIDESLVMRPPVAEG